MPNVWILTYEAGNMAISDPQIALECLLVDAHCNIIEASLVAEVQKLSCTKNGNVKSFFGMTSSCLPFFIIFLVKPHPHSLFRQRWIEFYIFAVTLCPIKQILDKFRSDYVRLKMTRNKSFQNLNIMIHFKY